MSNKAIALVILFLVVFLVACNKPEPEPPSPTPIPREIPMPTPAPVVVLGYKDERGEEWLWNTLNRYTDNEIITAAIIGYYWRESFFRSDAAAGWPTALASTGVDHCKEFTEDVDAGLADGSTRERFIETAHYRYGGYGMGKWCGSYLPDFYDFAQAWGTSIADAEMQCAFTVDSMRRNEKLWDVLQETEDPATVGWLVGVFYDGTRTGAGYIGQVAREVYERRNEDGTDDCQITGRT